MQRTKSQITVRSMMLLIFVAAVALAWGEWDNRRLQSRMKEWDNRRNELYRQLERIRASEEMNHKEMEARLFSNLRAADAALDDARAALARLDDAPALPPLERQRALDRYERALAARNALNPFLRYLRARRADRDGAGR